MTSMHSLIQEIQVSHRPKRFFYRLFHSNLIELAVYQVSSSLHFLLIDTEVHTAANAIITLKKHVWQIDEKSLGHRKKPVL